RSHFTCHARNFRGERIQLIDHRVDGVLEFENLALHIDRDLLGEVALSNGSRYFGDVAYLAGEVTGHEVHIVGQVFPGSGYTHHLRLTSETSLSSYFTRHARHFRSEGTELIHHGVDSVLEFEDLALHVYCDLLRQIAVGHRRSNFRDVAHLTGEVAGHEVHAIGKVFPGTGHAAHIRLTAEFPFCSHFAGHARNFRGEAVKLIHHGVDGVLKFENLASDVDCDLL